MSYDPTVGRWTSEDPIAFEGGDPNLYRYVGNAPTDGTDPTGLVDSPTTTYSGMSGYLGYVVGVSTILAGTGTGRDSGSFWSTALPLPPTPSKNLPSNSPNYDPAVIQTQAPVEPIRPKVPNTVDYLPEIGPGSRSPVPFAFYPDNISGTGEGTGTLPNRALNPAPITSYRMKKGLFGRVHMKPVRGEPVVTTPVSPPAPTPPPFTFRPSQE